MDASATISSATVVTSTEDWRILVAFGLDSHYNHGLREFIWYGIWIHVLKDFMAIQWCYLLGQFPLWAVNNNSTTENEANSALDSNINANNGSAAISQQAATVTTPARSEQLSTSDKSPSSSTSSEFSIDMTADIPVTPVNERFPLEVPPAPSQLSTRSMARVPETPPSPLRAAMTKANHIISLMKEEIDDGGNAADGTYEDVSIATSGPPIAGTHKVPDFAIVHLKHDVDENMVFPGVRIRSCVVPILVEIKRYICRRDDHNDTESLLSRYTGYRLAIKALRTQIKYLFSSGTQSAVVAIAASGNYWFWVQFIRENGKFVTKLAKGDTPKKSSGLLDPGISDITRDWSGEFLIGTELSDQMFRNIGDWVRKFNDDPHNTGLDVVLAT